MQQKRTLAQLATESIGFQDGSFRKALIADLVNIRNQARELERMSTRSFCKSQPVLQLLSTIAKFTGLKVIMQDGQSSGPAMGIPFLSKNHVLFSPDLKDMVEYFDSVKGDVEFSINNVLKSLKRRTISGEIDLKQSKVSGVFCELENPLYYPRSYLLGDFLTHEENAAVILHELGHAFTFMEYLTRMVSTNQAIATLSRTLDGSITPDTRVIIFDKAADAMDLSKTQKEALKNAKSQEQIAVIVLDREIEASVSELGFNLYDVNSCEYLADQFAARHQAGSALVTALDKIVQSYALNSFIGNVVMLFSAVCAVVSTSGLLLPVLILVLIFSPNKGDDIYDNLKSRFIRAKHQLVEQLKNEDLDANVRTELLSEISIIDSVSERHSDQLGIVETLAYYLRPGYRNAHKYELLQKDLERIGTSDLFVAAGKLKNV